MQRCHPRLRADCGAAFAVEKDGREQLVLVFEVERHKQGQFGEVFQAIRRAVAGEHDLNVDAIVLIRAGTVPKTSSGKIQRHACRQSYLDGTLDVVGQWQLGDAEEPVARFPLPRTAAGSETRRVRRFRRCSGPRISPAANQLPIACRKVAARVAGEPRHEPAAKGRQGADGHAGSRQRAPSGSGSGRGRRRPTKSAGGRRCKTAQIVIDEIRRVAKERANGMTLDSPIAESGMDSLERMEILATLEERFGGRFPPEILIELETTRQVIAAVEKYLGTEPRTRPAGRPAGAPAERFRRRPTASTSSPSTGNFGSGSTCWRLPGWGIRTSAYTRESPTIGP